MALVAANHTQRHCISSPAKNQKILFLHSNELILATRPDNLLTQKGALCNMSLKKENLWAKRKDRDREDKEKKKEKKTLSLVVLWASINCL